MRRPHRMFGFALVAGALSCGKQLNPEYCVGNPNDPDCRDAGLVLLDAAPRCGSDGDCAGHTTGTVCDATSGACVACTLTDQAACTANAQVCAQDDTCVGCTTSMDCASGAECLPDNTCGSTSNFLYATPNGTGTTCASLADACTLTNAVAHAGAAKNIIQLQGGNYDEGTITLGVAGLQLLVAAGANVTIGPKSGGGGTLFTVTANASIYDMTLSGAGGDAIDCSGATLVLSHLVIEDAGDRAVYAKNCIVTLTRSQISGTRDEALYFDGSSNITVINNFIWNGGNTGDYDGAVSLNGDTKGEVRFNTIAFNTAHSKLFNFDTDGAAGFSCPIGGGVQVNVSDNLLADDKPDAYSTFGAECGDNPTNANWIGSASQVAFAHATGTIDLHLTALTPDPTNTQGIKAIRDNANTNCNDVANDIDNDTRPYNMACDYGADEYTGSAE